MEDTLNASVSLFTIWGVRIVGAFMILIAGWVIGNWVKKLVQSIDKLDDTLKSFLGGLVKYAIFAISLVTILGQFGIQTASLLAVIGAAGLAIGLALQGTLSNVAAGVMLLILRPFNVGDFIEASGISGSVKDLGLFGTELATSDNIFIFVPNSQVWNSDIKNFSRNKQRRTDFTIGISYHDDINKAIKTIQTVLNKNKRLIITSGKESEIVVVNLGDFSVDLKVRYWTSTANNWNAKCDLIKAIKEALDKNGISIPFPTTTIEYANAFTHDNILEVKKKTA